MYRIEPMELDPRSFLWRYAGDQRLGFSGLSAGILQLMHPGLGAGVVEHSAFFTEPWDRIQRSIPEIIGVIYDAEPEVTGHRVRDYHKTIKGTDDQGRKYSALKPETFWWAHATFQFSVEQLIDRFSRRDLTPEDRETLYREGLEWYRRYGVSARPVPADYAAFTQQWNHYCSEVLELTPAAERAVDMALHDKVNMPYLPWWSRPIQREVLTPLFRLTAIGGLPPTVRTRFGIPFGVADTLRLKSLELWVRQNWWLMPRQLRWAPRAAAGWKRTSEERKLARAS